MRPMRKVAGVDLGGTNIRAAVVDSGGKILKEKTRLTLAERAYEEILRDILRCIEDVAGGAEVARMNIAAIGIGSPGPLNLKSGRVEMPPNLPTFRDVPLRDDVEKFFGVQTALANDAYCAGRGECWLGAGKNYACERVAGVTLGTGFGSWAKDLLPEFGHMIPIEDCGALCNCGQRGCPEAYISGYGLVWLAARRGLRINSAEELHNLLENKNRLAEIVVREAGRYLGKVLVNIAHVYQPRLIVVGGSIVKLGNIFLAEAEHEMRARGFASMVQDTKIVPAELGDNAGVLGAARLALDLACIEPDRTVQGEQNQDICHDESRWEEEGGK